MALDLSQPFPKNERLLPVPESLVDAIIKEMEEEAERFNSDNGHFRSLDEMIKANYLSEAYYRLKEIRETI